MLVIIFLGLIAKLTSVSGDCVVGPQHVNINWNTFTGNKLWYYRLHNPGAIGSNLRCFVMKYGSPVGNISPVTIWAYDNSTQSNVTFYANATNWTSTSWEETYPLQTFLTGKNYPIAIDYNRYFIYKYCFSESNQLDIYVAYLKPFPDENTVKDVERELKKNNIEYSQLVDWPMTNCK